MAEVEGCKVEQFVEFFVELNFCGLLLLCMLLLLLLLLTYTDIYRRICDLPYKLIVSVRSKLLHRSYGVETVDMR